MMMTTDKTVLEQSFAAMRAEDVPLSEDLLDRIMMDADRVLAEAHAAPAPARAPLSLGGLIRDVIGGWPSFGGLAAATVAGLWIGISPPDVLIDLTTGYWGTTIEVPLLESDVFAGLEG